MYIILWFLFFVGHFWTLTINREALNSLFCFFGHWLYLWYFCFFWKMPHNEHFVGFLRGGTLGNIREPPPLGTTPLNNPINIELNFRKCCASIVNISKILELEWTETFFWWKNPTHF